MISRGQYLGSLYDIGFYVPEAHAIRKDNSMYYAFYTKHWNGKIELRGLEDKTYRVTDYVNGKDYGVVQGPVAQISAAFSKHLLLEADPQ
jgi:alpha-galactosidase